MNDRETTTLPRSVPALGIAGLVPFLASLAWGWAEPGQRDQAAVLFIVYGAAILSFLGGTRWGLGLIRPDTPASRFVEAVLPSLLAVAALVVMHLPALALTLLSFGFALWALLDVRDTRWPAAYRRMRLGLSVAVLVMHGAWGLLLL